MTDISQLDFIPKPVAFDQNVKFLNRSFHAHSNKLILTHPQRNMTFPSIDARKVRMFEVCLSS